MASNLAPYPTFTKPQSSKVISPLYTVGRVRIQPSTLSEEYYNDIVSSCIDYYKSIQTKKSKKEISDAKKECQSQIKCYLQWLQLDTTVIDAEMVLSVEVIMETEGEIIVQLLDAGIHQIIIDIPSTTNNATSSFDLCECKEELKGLLDTLPMNRLGMNFPSIECYNEHQDLLSYIQKISIPYNRLDDMNSFWNLLKHVQDSTTPSNTIVFSLSSSDITAVSSLSLALFKKELEASLTLCNPSATELGECYAACISCDRKDGLFSTVVCTRDGHALGLVYSSKESIIKSLETGRGVYYSRSRQSLWKKGDTSGHYQTLHRIDLDCDRDAVRFTVTQHGTPTPSFCHLNTLSCWGEMRGMHHLQHTLQSRLENTEEGSYTQRLFHDEELLKQKLLEESLELIEAKTKQHVAEELADVMYFALVKATKHGVTMEDAIRELEKRSKKITRRKGDSKKERIEEGLKVLEQIGKS